MTSCEQPAEKSFDSISSIETLAFGGDDAYTIADSTTRAIKLSTKAQTAGISKIDVTKALAGTAGVLDIDASTFTSSTNLTVIGADDKDVTSKSLVVRETTPLLQVKLVQPLVTHFSVETVLTPSLL